MISLIRTAATNPDFVSLVKYLDSELAILDGEDHAFYDQFNKLDSIKYVVIAYVNKQAVGCGAIKRFDENTMEIKRMYTMEASRGKGIAKNILAELETWTAELGFNRCILETGIRQPEAISLYLKCKYYQIENYGQYKDVAESLCFEKLLNNLKK